MNELPGSRQWLLRVSRELAVENEKLRAQRDEARELVRRVIMWSCNELNEEQSRRAIARWDEEAKR